MGIQFHILRLFLTLGSKVKSSETILFLMLFTISVPAAHSSAFDIATGNAALEIIQPRAVSAIRQDFSPTAGDATLVLRGFVLVSNSWYDAVAPYHPTAVGVYSRLGRRPLSASSDNRQMNISILYASHRVLSYLFPKRRDEWDSVLLALGLDPSDMSEDLDTAIGIGNAAGRGVIEGRSHDGFNELGDEGGRRVIMRPYADYTGYAPVNSAYELVDPSRWQPQMMKIRGGNYQIQQFVTPQYRYVEPYSFDDPNDFGVPAPINSDFNNLEFYSAQADQVLAESVILDDRKKALAEFFDDKILSLGGSGYYSSSIRDLGLFGDVVSNFFSNVAVFDAGIVIWQEKAKYDAVRPFSAIRMIYRGKTIRSYMGPETGSIGEIPGEEWVSYLPEADHPEYPSASACFCVAHSEIKRQLFGTDKLGLTVGFAKGSSRIEPGSTPKSDIRHTFATWTDFAETCGQSRVWAGVHFRAAVDESAELCPVFGEMAYEYMMGLVGGTTELREPSRSRFNR